MLKSKFSKFLAFEFGINLSLIHLRFITSCELPCEEAKTFVVKEYLKVGEGAVEWYDIKYWLKSFQLEANWKVLLERYTDKIKIYPDVNNLLERLSDQFALVLTSNAGREFIDVEMEATGLKKYFDRIFSATSDFKKVKKTADFYQRICQILGVRPQEIVHVGDHHEFDYLVPRSLGIHAFYLDRSGEQKGDFTLSDLGDFEKRLPAIAD